MERRDVNLTPAFLAAILLHLAVVLGSMFVWPHKMSPISNGETTVTLVAAPAAELRPAVAAEKAAPAQPEAPDVDAPIAPPAPAR